MAWRNWSVIVVLVLANYLVFSLLATLVFPATPITAPTHVPRPTYTLGILELRSVGTLSYSFLTPTVTPTQTLTGTATIAATGPAATPRGTTLPTTARETRVAP